MKYHIVLLFVLLISVSGLNAQAESDHLIPDNSFFLTPDFAKEYESYLEDALFKDLSSFYYARALVCPSFTPEYLLSVEKNETIVNDSKEYGEKIYLKYRSCKTSVWNSYNARKKTEADICRNIEIDTTLAYAIQDVFDRALLVARFNIHLRNSDQRIYSGCDGTNYYFFKNGYNSVCGKVWSPPSGTKMDELTQISERLKEYAFHPTPVLRKAIIDKSNRLIVQFDQERSPKPDRSTEYERYIWIAIVSILSLIITFLLLKKR